MVEVPKKFFYIPLRLKSIYEISFWNFAKCYQKVLFCIFRQWRMSSEEAPPDGEWISCFFSDQCSSKKPLENFITRYSKSSLPFFAFVYFFIFYNHFHWSAIFEARIWHAHFGRHHSEIQQFASHFVGFWVEVHQNASSFCRQYF